MAERPESGTGSGQRLSICYVVPGHNLLPSAGPTRNVLSLAQALTPFADVTVAFRRVLEFPSSHDYEILEVEPGDGRETPTPSDDAAVRGIGYLEFLGYLHSLRRFARARASGFDLVLEKSWLLSGYVSARCRESRVPAIAVENVVPAAVSSGRTDPMARAKHWVGRWVAGRYLRRASRVVVETEHLAHAVSTHWRVPEERIEVVDLGVDADLFRPRDSADARRSLGLTEEGTILLYVGVLDRMHDLRPALDAMAAVAPADVELHIVGDGALRRAYQQLVNRLGLEGRVRFHGRLSHSDVPAYVAAADLCLAPYDPAAFLGREVGYSTLKIREYVAAGRPLVSVRSGAIPRLVEDGVTGFLIDHTRAAWRDLFGRLPGQARLREMGRAAAARPVRSWADVARDYIALCEEEVARARAPGELR